MTPAFALLLALPLPQSPGDDDAFARRITPEVRVVQSAAPSVVYVESDVITQSWSLFGPYRSEGQSSGSGVVIHEDGYIVTNYHVVKGATKTSIRFDPQYDERVYPASVLSFVEHEDLALLKIDEPGPFPTVPLGTSSDLMRGERVLAIGNPYGQTFTVSSGIISGLHRDIKASGLEFRGLIQTDASINPGNSGGPLLNINGELIGINTAVNTFAENIGFAIPVDRVWKVLQDQLLSSSKWRAWLGYEVDERLVVTRVVEDGPAAAAGLRIGDRITRIGETPVASEEDYRFARLAVQPHRAMAYALEGRGGARTIEMTAWDRANGILFERAGLTVESITLGRRSPVTLARVTGVREGGPASALQIEEGDLIEAVRPDGGAARIVREPEQLALLVHELDGGTGLNLELWRDDNGNGRYERNEEYSELYKGRLVLD